jgi:hypothetical protein
MTQVHSSGGARAPFATPVSKGKAKAAAQPDKRIAVPRAIEAKPSAPTVRSQTQVSFGKQALHALENTGEFIGKALLTGVEDVGEAAYYTVKALGTGVIEAAKGLEVGVVDGAKGVGSGLSETASAIGHGVVHVENALGDVWGMATQGMTSATSLAMTLGNDAQALVSNVGTAATDVGIGAKAVLSGVGSAASTAANYGTYVVKQAGKAISELT